MNKFRETLSTDEERVKEINEILNTMLNSESEAIIVKTPDELREILSNAKEEIRQFDHHTTWDDVRNMTAAEAISILSRLANSDGRDWSARPHLAKACQMAIEALKLYGNQ